MTNTCSYFGVNTYSYTLDRTALDCVRGLGEQGYRGIELMMYPGHLWPTEIDAAGRRALRAASEKAGIRITSINMPNIDINIAGASKEMRDYSLKLLASFHPACRRSRRALHNHRHGKSQPALSTS